MAVKGKLPAERPPLEREVQAAIVDLFKRAGCRVYSSSQYRASHVSVGWPDLFVRHCATGRRWWFEVKSYKPGYSSLDPATWIPKPLSDAQERFAAECQMTGEAHYWGGYLEAEAALVAEGLAERFGRTVRILPLALAPATR